VTQSSEATVIIYTHPDCAFSGAAKMDYRHRGIPFVEIDVSKEKDKVDDLLSLTGGERVTPVIVEDGKATIGFKGGN
jgi:glutaredoxin